LQCFCHRPTLRLVNIEQGNARSLAGEAFGGRPADARSRTRYQSDSIFKTLHLDRITINAPA
jgi:hypothetical protein